jgi:mannosyl-3-phosphoglycerate synthase
MVNNFCRFAKKDYAMFHQRSEELAEVFRSGGYHDVLDDDGLVRHGKAEGMIAGILLARLLGKKYVGFIDADNFFPGAVLEYVRLFSAGFTQAKTRHTMVRVQWHSKPKIVDSELFFARLGRVTRITNQYLNHLLSLHTGFESDIILTGNAGEHALSMDLALSLDYSAGFSVETNHFINMLEKFGGVLPSDYPQVMRDGVEVFQMQSRNPHFHEVAKGKDHLKEMIEGSLSVIYHSPLCPETLKKDILSELKRHKILTPNKKAPTDPKRYRALDNMHFDKAAGNLDWEKHGILQSV